MTEQTITPEQHLARMWRLAKAEMDCPRLVSPLLLHGHGCELCRGTGRVPLLPGVRVPSSPCWGKGYRGPCLGRIVEDVDCKTCHGLGYVPSPDPETWAQALGSMLHKISNDLDNGIYETKWLAFQDYIKGRVEGNFPAALEAAERVLVSAGMMEVQD